MREQLIHLLETIRAILVAVTKTERWSAASPQEHDHARNHPHRRHNDPPVSSRES